MKKTIWQTLSEKSQQNKRPIMILAPMEDVTDTVFRQIIIDCGRPDLFFTEFTNADGLCSPGAESVAKRLLFQLEEKPLIAQIWGNNPEHYREAITKLKDMQFDGIDINMGCPERSVVAKGCCSGLIRTPQVAKELITVTKEAAGDLPISVKTRIGYNKIQTEEWIGFLLEQDLAAITVHGRTTKEMSKVPAHWDEIGKAVILRNTMKKDTLIIGNGDVLTYEDAREKTITYGLDGIMVGRGIFQNPWLFNPDKQLKTITLQERINLLIKHITLFDTTWGDKKPFHIMKKYCKIYISGFDGASEIRAQIMEKNTAKEVKEFLQELVKKI